MKGKKDSESDIKKVLGIGKSSKRKISIIRWIILLFIITGITITVTLLRDSEKVNSIEYKTMEGKRGDLTVTVTATGTLEPINHVEVGSELSGIIKSVEVDFNERVKAGQVLARLDTEKLQAQVVQSEAALESAKAKVLEAQATIAETQSRLNRLKQLYKLSNQEIPSQNEMDAAEAAFKRAQASEAIAKAQVSEAKAHLVANKTDLSKALILSPINGIVLNRNVEPGQTVAASLQAPVLFILAEDLTQMELHVDVDEVDVVHVKEGQDAIFTVDSYTDRRFQATVTQVRFAPQTTEGVVTYEAILITDNSDLLLRPGMTAAADIVVSKVEDAILVPNASLRFNPNAIESQNTRENRNLLTMLLRRRPRRHPSSNQQKTKPPNNDKQRLVWILKDKKPVAIPIKIGSTDGFMTEVIEGDIEPGLPLLVDMVRPQK